MAKNNNQGTGDGLAWFLLVVCLALVGFVTFRSQIPPTAGQTSNSTLQWNEHGDSSSDDLFAPATTAPSIQVTEEIVSSTETEPITEASSVPSETTGDNPSLKDPLLVLVNRDHPAPSEKPELTRLKEYGVTVATAAADALKTMINDGTQLGLRFVVCSAYRSTELQHKLFEEDLNARLDKGMSYEEAWAATAAYTMPPGCSEHCTGLAMDIVSYYHQQLDDAQENTAETRWLQSHCWEYGFVLRYPKDKEDVTGIAYESWHYRYVGKEAAKYMTENDLTLEEYHAQNS